MAKTLIRNGHVISMDQSVGDLPNGDILIDGNLIVDVGVNLLVEDADVLDASKMTVIPGLINAHIHLWQTALRGMGSDWAGSDYYNYLHANLATRYRPDDTFVATLIGALNQLDCGSTTVFDWCHNNPTPAHSDAAIDALQQSGIRAVFGHGTVKPKPKDGEPHFSTVPHPANEIRRLRDSRSTSDEGLLSLAMCILGPDYSTLDVNRHDFRLARELDLLSSAHVWGRDNRLVADGYRTIADEGLLGPDHNLAHGNYLSDDEIKLICDSGATVTSTPGVEIRGHVKPPVIGRVAAAGGQPSIGVDSEVTIGGDMFNTMRTALQVQRIHDNLAHADRLKQDQHSEAAKFAQENQKVIGTGGSMIKEMSVKTRQALEWATINNAKALRMDHKIGSLSPGKQADIVLLTRDTLNILPVNDPVQSIVFNTNSANVDTVFVAGRKKKASGALLVDTAVLMRRKEQLIASSEWLLSEAGLNCF